MPSDSSGCANGAKCFLEHQMVKPATAILGITFAALVSWVGITHFNAMNDRFRQSQLGSRPLLGIQVIAPDELVARMFSFPPGDAVMVNHVEQQSLAQQAGIQRGDGIVAVQGRAVGNPNDMAAALSKLKQGDILRLTVVRGGLVHNVVLPLDTPAGG